MMKRAILTWPLAAAQVALLGGMVGGWPSGPLLLAQLGLTACATWAAWPSLCAVATRVLTAMPAAPEPQDEADVPPVVVEPLDQRLARAEASYRDRVAQETTEREQKLTAAKEERRARARARAARKAAARV